MAGDNSAKSWLEEIDRYWLRLTLLAWAVIAGFYVIDNWNAIQWLSLGDTDDNMRLMQVRGLLGGQGWYDLVNHRMNPPVGANIHWSRLVDLPIAGLILLLRPFLGVAEAERVACGIAPLLPLSLAMVGLSATVRRLVDPLAWPLAVVLLIGCASTMSMYMPDRIDHHGWQLAMLALTVAGLSDPDGPRGGALVGLSTAVSLTIGLEMLPYAAGAGAILALRWILDRADAPRLTLYAVTLGTGTALGYLVFASEANSIARCDALTPVWLSVMVVAGALLFALAWWNPANRWLRLGGAAAAGAAIAIGFVRVFPQCATGRLEQVSPELATTWLNNVREARPIYTFELRQMLPVVVLPIIALVGSVWATLRARGAREAAPAHSPTRPPSQATLWAAGWEGGPAPQDGRFARWLPVLLFSAFSATMLAWQARFGPAAQLLAVPGATALAWIVIPKFLGARFLLVRVFGTLVAFLVVSGLFVAYVLPMLPVGKPDRRTQIINRAGARCPTIPALAPLDRLTPQVIFTMVDLGPRLITVTHHDAVAGPYHRNGDAILDIHHAFTGTPENFRAIALRHNAHLLLVCPNMAETTLYQAHAPNGFYAQLARGQVPAFLTPIPMPAGSPLRLWKID